MVDKAGEISTQVSCSKQGQVSFRKEKKIKKEKREKQPRFQPAGLKAQTWVSGEAVQPTQSLDSSPVFHLLDTDLNNVNPPLILPKPLIRKKWGHPMLSYRS